jgi:hypothetical protein
MATSSNDPNAEVADLLRELIRLQGGSSAMGVKPKKSGPNLDDATERLNLIKNVREYAKGMREATSVAKSMTNVFEGVREELNFEDAGRGLGELNKALGKTTDSVEIAAIKEQRAELTKAVAIKTAVSTAANFAGGMLKAANMIADASRAFELSIQSGASGVEAGTQNLIASIQANKQIQDTQADVVKDVSAGLGTMAMAFGPVGMIIGGLITTLGPLVASYMKFNNEQEAKAAEHRAKLYGEELKKTQESYHTITAAGASFAGGMGEMRAQAANAGMRLKDFSEMVKGSVANLASMGMGVAQAAQRIGGVSKVLRSTDLGMQLRNLGLSIQEQSEAAAAAAANLNASGRLRSMSDAQVAQVTVAYTKDLKILQGITGEDAKKKMEEARMRSMEADLLAQAMAKGGPEAMEKLRNQLATMPESMKKGYMEFVSTGGTAVADAATNVAISQNPRIMEQYQQMYTTLGDGSKNASDALRETGSLTEQTAAYARQNADSVKEMATAARLGASELGQATIQIHNDLILANQRFTEGVTEATAANVEALSKTQDDLTNAVNRLEEETNAAAVALEKRLTPGLAGAADAMPRFTGAMNSAIDALNGMAGNNVKAEEVGGLAAGAAGAYALGSMGAAFGTAIAPGVGTAVGAAVGASVGGAMGYFTGSWLGKKADESLSKEPAKPPGGKESSWYNPASWFAKGGIATGPVTGFPAMLHGTEAVVPLPDGKTLPVNIDMGTGFFDSMKETMGIATGMLGKVSPVFGIAEKLLSTPTKGAPQVSGFDMPSIFNKVSSLATGVLNKVDPTGTVSGISDEVMKTFNDTILTLNKKTDNIEGNSALKEMRDLIKAQLSKHDEMITQLKESVDINQRLLNQSYT